MAGGSTDASRELLLEKAAILPDVRVLLQDQNRGKGAALRRGFAEARGDVVIVQDADLEYDPAQIPVVVAPLPTGSPTWCTARVFSAARTGCSISGTSWATAFSRCCPTWSATST